MDVINSQMDGDNFFLTGLFTSGPHKKKELNLARFFETDTKNDSTTTLYLNPSVCSLSTTSLHPTITKDW